MASPERLELLRRLDGLESRLRRRMSHALEQRMQQLDYLARRLVHPGERLTMRETHLGHLRRRLEQAATRALGEQAWRIERLSQRWRLGRPDIPALHARLDGLDERLGRAAGQNLSARREVLARLDGHLRNLNPQTVLERGFSLTQDAHGNIVRDSATLAAGDLLRIAFAKGTSHAQVRDVE